MPNHRRRGGFSPFSIIGTVFGLVLAIALIVVWANINNIRSIDDTIQFFKDKSDEVGECINGFSWDCPTPDFGSGNEDDELPETPDLPTPADFNTEQLISMLDDIEVQDPLDITYDRGDWPHWNSTGDGCRVREEVLKNQGTDVVVGDNCRIESGTWVDPFTGDTFTNSSDLDIDHVLPTSYVAQQVGDNFDAETREAFANDPIHLLAVSASQNRSKGDKGPSEYMPPNEDFHCEYAEIWVVTASEYDIPLVEADKTKLEEVLASCG